MSVIVISHAQCTDGWGSVNALQKVLGTEGVEYLTLGHSDVANELANSIDMFAKKVVIIVDYSLPVAIWEQVCAVASQVITLDHHNSAYEDYLEAGIELSTDVDVLNSDVLSSQKVITIFDQKYSGAMLAYKLAVLLNSEVDFSYAELELLKLIQDQDLNQQNYLASTHLYAYIANNAMYADSLVSKACLTAKQLQDGMYFWHQLCQNMTYVLKEGKARHQLFTEQVNTLAGYAEQLTLTVNKEGVTHQFSGMMINANFLFANELGSLLAKKTNSFSIVYYIINGKIKMSLRSVAGYDASVIAKLFGGGGHAQSCACVVEMETLFDIIEGKTIHL